MKNLHQIYISTVLLALFPANSFAALSGNDNSTTSNILRFDSYINTNIRISKKVLSFNATDKTDTLVYNQKEEVVRNYPQYAKVCFITDTGECGGMAGGGGEEYPNGGGPDWDNDSAKRCINEGYVSKPCPAGQEAYGVCPYNSNYAVECRCRTDLQECTKPYYGAGAECGGRYERCEVDYEKACEEENPNYTNTCSEGWQVDPKDQCKYNPAYGTCCNKCEGYYLQKDIPSGYVADTTQKCESCDGTKYIKKCDVGTQGSGGGTYVKCGTLGGVSGGGTCSDGSGSTYYKECKCPLNFEWNASTKECVCLTSFKYTCTGTGYAGGESSNQCSGNNKYRKCNCADGYTWSDSSGCIQCGSSFQFACTGANEIKPSTGACGNRYTTCLCATGYTRYCTTPTSQDCSTLGYKSTSSCEGGLKCPWGNYWFCPA